MRVALSCLELHLNPLNFLTFSVADHTVTSKFCRARQGTTTLLSPTGAIIEYLLPKFFQNLKQYLQSAVKNGSGRRRQCCGVGQSQIYRSLNPQHPSIQPTPTSLPCQFLLPFLFGLHMRCLQEMGLILTIFGDNDYGRIMV